MDNSGGAGAGTEGSSCQGSCAGLPEDHKACLQVTVLAWHSWLVLVGLSNVVTSMHFSTVAALVPAVSRRLLVVCIPCVSRAISLFLYSLHRFIGQTLPWLSSASC